MNESIYQNGNGNGVRIVKFAISEQSVITNTMFPHRNIRKYIWTSPDGKTHNQTDHVLMIDRRWHSSIPDVRSFRGADCGTNHCLEVTKVREILAVSKQTAPNFDVERFKLRKLNGWEFGDIITLRSQTGLQLGELK